MMKEFIQDKEEGDTETQLWKELQARREREMEEEFERFPKGIEGLTDMNSPVAEMQENKMNEVNAQQICSDTGTTIFSLKFSQKEKNVENGGAKTERGNYIRSKTIMHTYRI